MYDEAWGVHTPTHGIPPTAAIGLPLSGYPHKVTHPSFCAPDPARLAKKRLPSLIVVFNHGGYGLITVEEVIERSAVHT